MGVFKYSKEEGTPAARLPWQIHGNTKTSRYNKIMKEQQKISEENLEKKIGKVYEVLIENISFDGKYYIGRTIENVPDIDGLIYIKNDDKLKDKELINKFVNCKVIKVNSYDLIGEVI